MIKGKLYKKLEKGSVSCLLCSHYCIISPDKLGICKVRKNISGELYSLNSDKTIAVSSDPIEKKPLYHFIPGSVSYSIAAMGCNFRCSFCQNHSISMIRNETDIYGKNIPVSEIIKGAIYSGAKSIAYTYTEPTIYYELMTEVAFLAKKENIKNIMVSNGYLSNESIDTLITDIDAINIDLKAFSDNFYKKFCKGSLSPVLNTIRKFNNHKTHVEITTLLINGKNDDPEEIKQLIEFILETNPEIPWHISRFYPAYEFGDEYPTDIESIYNIAELGYKMGLKYIYTGNIQNNRYSNTLCPACSSTLINRSGYATEVTGLKNGKCTECHEKIYGIWE